VEQRAQVGRDCGVSSSTVSFTARPMVPRKYGTALRSRLEV
jgi:hypothetical protein